MFTLPGDWTMSAAADLDFHHADLIPPLDALDQAGIDSLPFGVIGFDSEGAVQPR
jgi:hypothetical protein